MTMPYDHSTISSKTSIEQCESGRVCMNICYYNGNRIDCRKQIALKSVLFNPSFNEILPTIYLRLIDIDTNNTMFNSNIIIEKENLTFYGMNIRFDVSIDSTMHYICADWLACSSNMY